MLEAILGRLVAGEDLEADQMQHAMQAMVGGACAEGQIGLFLTALHAKGETVAEVAGAARALRGVMTPIRSHHAQLVDTCGTGGSGMNLFNVSTAAALVTAAAGVPVAKHGNRAVTSRSGSADVLAELGVRIDMPIERVEACLNDLGICFCFAPLFHPSMRHVGAVRRALGMPTIFNLLGPLCNPAGATAQVIGVGRSEHRRLIAEALATLGAQCALVVHGNDGLDEFTLADSTAVTWVRDGHVLDQVWHPEDFGIPASAIDTLRVENAAESARLIRTVLAGEPGPARDIVVLNAAAALSISQPAQGLSYAAQQATAAIDSGAAQQLLARLVRFS